MRAIPGVPEESGLFPEEPNCKPGHQCCRRHQRDLASGPVASVCCACARARVCARAHARTHTHRLQLPADLAVKYDYTISLKSMQHGQFRNATGSRDLGFLSN